MCVSRDWDLFCCDEPRDGFRLRLFLPFRIVLLGTFLYTPFAADIYAFLSNLPSGLEGLRQGNACFSSVDSATFPHGLERFEVHQQRVCVRTALHSPTPAFVEHSACVHWAFGSFLFEQLVRCFAPISASLPFPWSAQDSARPRGKAFDVCAAAFLFCGPPCV